MFEISWLGYGRSWDLRLIFKFMFLLFFEMSCYMCSFLSSIRGRYWDIWCSKVGGIYGLLNKVNWLRIFKFLESFLGEEGMFFSFIKLEGLDFFLLFIFTCFRDIKRDWRRFGLEIKGIGEEFVFWVNFWGGGKDDDSFIEYLLYVKKCDNYLYGLIYLIFVMIYEVVIFYFYCIKRN